MAHALPQTLSRLGRLAQLSRRWPVVVRVFDWPTGQPSGDLIRGLRSLPYRVVIGDDGERATLVRAELRGRTDLALRASDWFRCHIRLGPDQLSLASLLINAGVRARPQDLIPKKLLRPSPGVKVPPARDWFSLGRGLRSVHLLQQGNASALQVALQLGFHDRSSLARHVNRVFGRSLAFVGVRLGIEWLVDDWSGGHLASRWRRVSEEPVTEQALRDAWIAAPRGYDPLQGTG
jgi:AraC-like DNA-binding protein